MEPDTAKPISERSRVQCAHGGVQKPAQVRVDLLDLAAQITGSEISAGGTAGGSSVDRISEVGGVVPRGRLLRERKSKSRSFGQPRLHGIKWNCNFAGLMDMVASIVHGFKGQILSSICVEHTAFGYMASKMGSKRSVAAIQAFQFNSSPAKSAIQAIQSAHEYA